MNTPNFTGMDRQAVAANNIVSRFGYSINIINGEIRLEYSFRTDDGHYGDAYDIVRGADDLADAIKELRNCSTIKIDGADAYDLCINNNCAVETEQGMVRGYALRVYKDMEWEMVAEYKTAIASKWTKSVASWAAGLLYGFLKNIADEMISALGSDETLGSDDTLDYEDEQEAIAEQMSEVVAEYQIKVNEQMMALHAVADSFDKIKYRIDYAKAASVVRRIEKLSWDCLQDCGKISGCEMVPDDGYCPNIDALIKWADGVLIDDLEETLDYMAVYEDRVAPIATDMVELLDSEWGYDYVMAPMTEDEAIKWYSLNYEDIKVMADEQKVELYALAF